MITLRDLIGAIEKEYGIRIKGSGDLSKTINKVSFLTPNQKETVIEETGTLYLADSSDDIDHIIEEKGRTLLDPILLLSNKENVPKKVLYITEEINIFEIFNTIQAELNKNLKRKEYEYKMFQTLYKGKGVEELLKNAHSFLNNPITICDSSFCILSSYPVVSDSRNLKIVKGRQYLKEEAFQDMYDRNIIDKLYESNEAIITHFEDYNYDWLFKNLRVNNTVIGYICVRSTVRDFKEEDLEFLNIFSQMLCIEMQKEINYFLPTGLWYEYFLTELLKGMPLRSNQIIEYLKYINGKKTKYFNLILLRSKDNKDQKKKFKSYFDQLTTILPGSMVVLFQGDLIILLPSNTVDPFENYSKNRLSSFLKLNELTAYISYPFTELEKSSTYYKQVLNLASIYPKDVIKNQGSFIYYGDNVLEEIFNKYNDKSYLKSLIDPDILELTDYDKEYETEFVITLKTYLQEDRNSSQTAQKLHIHKSTFFYRIKKMEELFGISIKHSKKLFDYEFSFRLLDYLN